MVPAALCCYRLVLLYELLEVVRSLVVSQVGSLLVDQVGSVLSSACYRFWQVSSLSLLFPDITAALHLSRSDSCNGFGGLLGRGAVVIFTSSRCLINIFPSLSLLTFTDIPS